MEKEEMYLGKKVSDLNVWEIRFRKMVQLMKIHNTLQAAKVTHKTLPKDGHL